MQRNDIESAKDFNSSPYQRMENAPLSQPVGNPNMNGPNPNYPYPQDPNFPGAQVPYQQPGGMPNRNTMEDYASDINKLKRQQSSMHCQALIATFFLIGGQATGLILFFNSTLTTGGVLGVCIGTYLLYLIIACCCNPLASYLGNISRGETFQHYYESLRNRAGHFVFHAQCYHYETHHHTRIVRDSEGNTRTEHYTTTEKVVTHRATELVHPSRTKDESGVIDQIRAQTTIIFVHYFVNHRFVDGQSQMKFNATFQNFKFRNTRDAHQDFSYRYELPGLIERKAYFIGELTCDYTCWYYLLGAIGLLWPYSMWVESKISRFRVDTMKVLTM